MLPLPTHRVGPDNWVRRGKIIADVEGRASRLDDRVTPSIGSGLEDGLRAGRSERLEVAAEGRGDAVVNFG